MAMSDEDISFFSDLIEATLGVYDLLRAGKPSAGEIPAHPWP